MRRLPLADALRVRTPCTVGWDTMTPEAGGTRHCASCEKSVIDVATLTHDEAESLVAARDRGASVCVHLHVRRDDGAILLADGHAFPGARAPVSFSERAKVIVAAASTVALAACATTPDAKVPELVPVVVAPLPPPPPDLPATPPPIPEPPPAVATAEPPEPMPPPAPMPAPPSAKSIAAKPAANSAHKKGAPLPTYDIVDGGI